jgi:hypothetical protein
MKPLSSILTFSIICFFLAPLSSQIPDNFEFLHHKDRYSKLGSSKVFNDDIYFVSHAPVLSLHCQLDQGFATTVFRVNRQGETEVLLETYLSSQSKIINNPDSSFDILLYSLIDYDIGASGFIALNVDSSRIQIDTIIDISLTDHRPTEFFGEINQVEDVYKNENGEWVSSRFDIYNETGLVRTEDFGNISYYNFVNNINQELYGISLGTNSKNSNVYRLIDGAADFVTMIEGDSDFQSLISISSGNYLFSSEKLVQYSVDFSEKIDEWNIELIQGEIVSSNSYNGRIEIHTVNERFDRLYELLPDGAVQLISEDFRFQDEKIVFFHRQDSEQVLFGGIHKFDSISEQVYFRNVNLIDNSSVDYPRVNLNINNVELIGNAVNDSVDVILSVSNEGDQFVNEFDCYSRLFIPQDPVNFWVYINLTANNIESGQSKSYQSPFKLGKEDLDFVLTGADNKFNASPNRIIVADFLSSTFDISDSEPLIVYPNPAQDYIQIDTNSRSVYLSIYNELGQLVYYQEGISNLNDNSFDISHLDSGLYHMVIREEDKGQARRSSFIKY